ncbi:hypothetical protein BT63DRAFT_290911 [Microthyrium microscopicum]|uniref:Uncharacterized protein n=1 Tax=Microthyrium microscopicum TaxID=703497 RepID=A0A6A6U524_9PEZI|nr:hypothetical protein BT63DRAFT_290911 [Microthyrium microscopicum]
MSDTSENQAQEDETQREMEVKEKRRSAFGNFFSKMSQTSPLLPKKSGSSPEPTSPSYKSPPPLYSEGTPVLDSQPIHELPVTEDRGPIELPASPAVQNDHANGSPGHSRHDPSREHATSWANVGAERQSVTALGQTLTPPVKASITRSPGRESWTSATSTGAVVDGGEETLRSVDRDASGGLGIR